MHIDYEISEQDYAAAQALAAKKGRPSSRWFLLFAPWLGLFLLMFLLWTLIKQGFSANLVPGLAFGLFFLALPIIAMRNIHNQYSKSTNMHGPLTLDMDDDALRFRGATFAAEVSWNHFARFCEDNNLFLMFQQGEKVFNILPKRCLSEEQIGVLREIFSKKLKTTADSWQFGKTGDTGRKPR